MKKTGCVKISDNTEQMFGYEMLIFWVVEKEGKVERMGQLVSDVDATV